jgi:hypothetical protein
MNKGLSAVDSVELSSPEPSNAGAWKPFLLTGLIPKMAEGLFFLE